VIEFKASGGNAELVVALFKYILLNELEPARDEMALNSLGSHAASRPTARQGLSHLSAREALGALGLLLPGGHDDASERGNSGRLLM